MQLSRTRLIVGCTALVLAAGVSLYIYQLVEEYLIRDPRFAIATPDGAPEQVLQVTGASHASVRAIEAVFTEDYGRSLYLVPMEDRLTTLRNVDWVRDASIARIWPNRLMVNVEERVPLAFVTLSSNKFALIDADGVILPPAKDQFNLPVLAGIKASDTLESRQKAVQRMLRLTADLGETVVSDVSEIDVADHENIAITLQHQDRVVKLLLGDRNYAQRYQTFVKYYSKVESTVPGAKVMDLRLDDRITVVEAE